MNSSFWPVACIFIQKISIIVTKLQLYNCALTARFWVSLILPYQNPGKQHRRSLQVPVNISLTTTARLCELEGKKRVGHCEQVQHHQMNLIRRYSLAQPKVLYTWNQSHMRVVTFHVMMWGSDHFRLNFSVFGGVVNGRVHSDYRSKGNLRLNPREIYL